MIVFCEFVMENFVMFFFGYGFVLNVVFEDLCVYEGVMLWIGLIVL